VALAALTCAALAALAACGDNGGADPDAAAPDADVAPAFRTPVDLPDDQLALRALQILGADVDGAESACVPCHSLSESKLREWGEYTSDALAGCLTDLAVSSQASALAMIDCVKNRSAVSGTKFATPALGFWAAGAGRDWWAYTFARAYPEDGAAQWATFQSQVKMPPGGLPALPDDDYDVVAEWFVRGQPLLDEMLDETPPPGQCDALITPSVGAHLDAIATTGWRASNVASGLLMYGCAGAAGPRDCLTDETDAASTGFGASWAVSGHGVLRVLHEVTYASAYWTRSSADGRFVGHGRYTSPNAAIIDLQADRVIPVDASYDPGFFPDNSGFVMQGGARNVCAMSVLTAGPASISMTEAGCADLGEVGLYQHVGALPGGGDYFAVDGPFVSDDGGHFVTHGDPSANFAQNSGASLTPMVFDGTTFQARIPVAVSTPYEGDAVLSPSAGLLISRVSGPSGEQNGFTMRALNYAPQGNSYQITAQVAARYCYSGGKPAFSYDEEWLVFHHYLEDTDADAQELGFADRNDPGFAGYRTSGASNIYLMSLRTGQRVRITNMAPNQYALYPHFRSDGWIYFIVRDGGRNREDVVASDAALVAEGL
ncbi:MAG: hypothetical protein KC464_13340, partial [Myxococcales bacterium]|nr:hypothetical protein [Myxococcales bacterium]